MKNSDLARLTGLSNTGISDIEKGLTENPKGSFFKSLHDELGVNLDWLVAGTGKMGGRNPAEIRWPGGYSSYIQRSGTRQVNIGGQDTYKRPNNEAAIENQYLKMIIEKQEETIKELRGRVSDLQNMFEELRGKRK
nr:helix-turn-helix transcriptional regulator [Sabulibacter ruber]